MIAKDRDEAWRLIDELVGSDRALISGILGNSVAPIYHVKGKDSVYVYDYDNLLIVRWQYTDRVVFVQIEPKMRRVKSAVLRINGEARELNNVLIAETQVEKVNVSLQCFQGAFGLDEAAIEIYE